MRVLAFAVVLTVVFVLSVARRRRRALVLAALLPACPACRACDGADSVVVDAGPPMPSGLLVPQPSSAPPPSIASDELFVLARGKTGGAWAELQLAPPGPDGGGARPAARVRWQSDSRFLSLEAMAFLHDPFATALPGFDLFVPHFFDPAALLRLAAELADREAQVRATTSIREAKERWASASSFLGTLESDEAWARVREPLLATLRDLAALARDVADRGQGLWVLGI